jgi:nicotinamide riboside kinase
VVKIAFIGTHGVGKTTLCFELAALLKRRDLSVDLVKEVARECPLPINRDTNLAAQSWILHTQVARELAAAANHDAVVCDRSVLDNYAYLVHATGRRPELEPLIREWLPTYRLLVKVPLWRPPAFDGVRDMARDFQTAIDGRIDGLLTAFRPRVLTLEPRDAGRWADRVVAALELPERAEQVPLFPEPGEHAP